MTTSTFVYSALVARITVPEGPGGDAAMVWTLRPEMGRMVEQMVNGVYHHSVLPAAEREAARMRIAQLNACGACAAYRASSVLEAGVTEDLYEHVADFRTHDGYTERQKLAIAYAELFATDHGSIDDAFTDKLRAAFSDAEVLDLTMCISVYLGLGRALAVLGIEEHAPVDL